MIYNKLGKTNLEVSRLGFGLMRLPIASFNPDFRNSLELITSALDLGINFFDIGTFYCHGYCEKAFGLASEENFSKKVILSGKNSSHQNNNFNWEGQLENTINVFGSKQLDIYFIHYLDLEVWNSYFIRNNVIQKVLTAKEKGLFKYLGFSSHDTPNNIKKLIDTRLFDAVILQYNLLETRNEKIIEYASKQGLGVIIMNPLAGGVLANLDGFDNIGFTSQDIRKYALKQVFKNPHIHCVLSGMQSIFEIKENIKLLEETFDYSNSINDLTSLLRDLRIHNRENCTQCNYCLPCPQGIHIPEVIKIYNKYGHLKTNEIFIREYRLMEIDATSCIECGICEKRCPNGIEVKKVMSLCSNKFN